MLFGSAVVVAILLAGSTESARSSAHRSTTLLWLESDVRPRQLDLTPKPPLDFKSVKVCGASGLGAFIPIAETIGLGVAYTTFRLSQTQRAAQFVLALRFRF
jgi:hypothetical protein